MQLFVHLSILVCISLVSGLHAFAKDSTVLTVAGAINAEQERVEFTLADLEAMGSTEIKTHTPWTEGQQTFTGVLFRKLLKSVGAQGQAVSAIALDEHRITIPWDEINEFPIIVAFKHNGEYMRIRDKGPLWIIYPLDDYPKLRTLDRESRMVWQLRTLIVK